MNSDFGIPYSRRQSKAPSTLTIGNSQMKKKNILKSSMLSAQPTAKKHKFLKKQADPRHVFGSMNKRETLISNLSRRHKDTKLTFDSSAVRGYMAGNSRRVIVSHEIFRREHKFLFYFKKCCSNHPHDNATSFLKSYFSVEILSVFLNTMAFHLILPDGMYTDIVSFLIIMGVLGLIYCHIKAIKNLNEWGAVSDQILEFVGMLSVFFNFLTVLVNFLMTASYIWLYGSRIKNGKWIVEYKAVRDVEGIQNEYWLGGFFILYQGIMFFMGVSQLEQYFRYFKLALDNLIVDYSIFLEIFADDANAQE